MRANTNDKGDVVGFTYDGESINEGTAKELAKKAAVEAPLRKFDSAKTRYDLIPPGALKEIADVLTYGATKYSAHNWAAGTEWSRYYNALRRHLEDWWGGEDDDPETNYKHLAHAGCCLLFLLAYAQEGGGTDDRRKPKHISW